MLRVSKSRWAAQFTPGSRTTLRTRASLTPSDREYTPARSADKHLPEAHCLSCSILSPAVTATGTTFWAAPASGTAWKSPWLVTVFGRWEARSAIEVTIEPMEPSSAERGCWGSKTLEEREKGAVIRDR